MRSAHPLTILPHACCRIGPLPGRRDLLGLTMDARAPRPYGDRGATRALGCPWPEAGSARLEAGVGFPELTPERAHGAHPRRYECAGRPSRTPLWVPRPPTVRAWERPVFRWPFDFGGGSGAARRGLAVVLVRFRHRPRAVRLAAWPLIIATPEALGYMIFDTSQAHPVAIAASYGRACVRAVTSPRPDLPVWEMGGGLPARKPQAPDMVTATRGRGTAPGRGRHDVRRGARAQVAIVRRGVGRGVPGGWGKDRAHGGLLA